MKNNIQILKPGKNKIFPISSGLSKITPEQEKHEHIIQEPRNGYDISNQILLQSIFLKQVTYVSN